MDLHTALFFYGRGQLLFTPGKLCVDGWTFGSCGMLPLRKHQYTFVGWRHCWDWNKVLWHIKKPSKLIKGFV